MPDAPARIAAVLVAYDSAAVIGAALGSLPPGVGAVVVDNASTDDSIAVAQGAGARVIANSGNRGFGTACNQGAAAMRAEFILFLNPDTVLEPGALDALAAALDAHPRAAIAGPALIGPGGAAIPRWTSFLHPDPPAGADLRAAPDHLCEMPLLSGAAMLCRRTAFAAAGGFDEAIFLYYEDDDLCLRLTKAGWTLIYEPAARVAHVVGGSSPPSVATARFKARCALTAQAQVARKHGLSFDPAREWRRALTRLAVATLKGDRRRRAAALGRIDALWMLCRRN